LLITAQPKNGLVHSALAQLIMSEPAPEKLDDVLEVDETYVGGTFAKMDRKQRREWQEARKITKRREWDSQSATEGKANGIREHSLRTL